MTTQKSKWQADGNNRALQKIITHDIRYVGAMTLAASLSVVLSFTFILC